jgi:hypothetical protein
MAGVFLGDSVEVQYEQPPAEPKTIYSWALYSPRRARARAELKMATGMRRSQYNQRQQRRYQVDPSASYGKAPAQAREMSRQHPSHVMAGELGRRRTEAQAAGAGAEGAVVARWAWWSIVGVVVPIAFLVSVIVAH